MRTCPAYIASRMYGAVKIHYIVIAYASKSPRPMPTVNICYSEIPATRCGCTMNNNLIDVTHIFTLILELITNAKLMP